MNPDATQSFTESVGRCLGDPAFLDRFYELFRDSSPEIADKFRDTDFDAQKRALSSSLYLIVMAMQGGDAARVYLEKTAERHDRKHLDIRPELYDIWLDCLIRAAREFDPQFDDELDGCWRQTLKFGIDFMRDRY